MVARKVNKIKKFIEDNELDFTGFGSELNSVCCIISGYACYLRLSFSELKEQMKDVDISDTDELRRVFEYAENNNYGEWWNYGGARSLYKF